MAKRLAGRCGYPEAPHEFDVTLHPEKLDEPLRWKKPTTVFVCSMSDLFHEDVPDRMLFHVFEIITQARQHTFQVLTKRPERMAEFCQRIIDIDDAPLPNNIWLGVTAENQEQADKRIPILLQIPAAVRFVSIEPMLGPVALEGHTHNWLPGTTMPDGSRKPLFSERNGYRHKLDWVIVGGETGPGARPMQLDWVRSLRDQCNETGTPFFFKSWGDWVDGLNVPDEHLDAALDCAGTSRDYRYMTRWGEIQAFRVGKKRAGRQLDQREWNELPEVE
jgi:protein gp37